MTKFYLVLLGADKNSPALLMPCGSYQFLYDAATNRHLLDGGELTSERFHEAAADMARRWQSGTGYKVAPLVEEVSKPSALTSDSLTSDLSPQWEQERAGLLAQLAAQEGLITAMQKTRRKAAPATHTT